MRPRGGGENRFPRAARLLRAAEFGRALKAGRRVSSGPLIFYVARAGQGDARLGIIIGRRAGPAAVRNRVKRSVREHFRRHRKAFPPGTSVVVVVTRDLSSVTSAALRQAVAEAFRAAGAGHPAGGTRRGPPEPPPR